MTSSLDAPVQYLKGVGPGRAALLAKLGLRTVGDLLMHFPVRYYDRRKVASFSDVREGKPVTVQGVVTRVRGGRTARRRMPVVEVGIEGPGGRGVLVWFRQPYRAREFVPGDRVIASGKGLEGRGRVAVEEFEFLEDDHGPVHAAGLIPAYATTAGLSKRQIRALVRSALEEFVPLVEDPLPQDLVARRRLPEIRAALGQIHRPETPGQAEAARRRFAYQELLALQVRLALRRREAARERAGRVFRVSDALDFRIRSLFPFRLTDAQERAVADLRRDLAAGPPMNRLLQGDVGAGKTVVAAYALLAAIGLRAQAAILAPTEILAEQHFRTFRRLLGHSRVRMAHLAGGLSGREREEMLAAVKRGEVDLVVATHAVLERDVEFKDLALAVVDEQQKFGVLQRATFAAKGPRPHVLVMTATPIPRTLALTVFGDLDVTVMEGRPPGRREVCTLYVPPAGRGEKLAFIRTKLKEGRQAYFVCPLVEESDTLALRSAIRMHEELQSVYREFRVALLHGRMKPEEKEAAMEEFRSGRAQVLVSTIVIEVGIDVPNASIMVIDHAERYGLAQLHQLRGRIGRGPYESFCILFGKRTERVDVFVTTNDGFKIAEADLRIRGAGELDGTRQSGVPDFRAARLPEDLRILEAARDDARDLVERDPGLASAPGLRAAGGASLLHVG